MSDNKETKQVPAVEAAPTNPLLSTLLSILKDAAKWLHAAYDRPPQTPEAKAMLDLVDLAIQFADEVSHADAEQPVEAGARDDKERRARLAAELRQLARVQGEQYPNFRLVLDEAALALEGVSPTLVPSWVVEVEKARAALARASEAAAGGAVGEMIESIFEGHVVPCVDTDKFPLPVGTKLYAAPQPACDQQISQIVYAWLRRAGVTVHEDRVEELIGYLSAAGEQQAARGFSSDEIRALKNSICTLRGRGLDDSANTIQKMLAAKGDGHE